MSEYLLETKNLCKYFDVGKGLKLHAVDGVSIKIPRGKTLGIVGESGCGKTTLGRTVLGLLGATSGEILYEGNDVSKMSGEQLRNMRRKMQIIFQDPYSSLNPRHSVSQTIAEPLIVLGKMRNKQALKEKVCELMDVVGLDRRFYYSYPHELDGGRRQRIGIARALALGPEFIVCDEPVSALDVSIQAQILNLLMDIQEEKHISYLFITHNLSVVKHISHEIAVLYLGQCVEQCETSALFEKPLHPYTKALLDSILAPEIETRNKEFHIIRGEITSPVNPPVGCRFAARCPYAGEQCTRENVPFEEVEKNHFVACIRCREINNI